MLGKKHYYTSDHSERRMVHVYLATVGILSSYGLFWCTQELSIPIPWWFDAPAIFGFYGLLYLIFSKYLWKITFSRRLMMIETPDWNGDYSGFLKSSYDNFTKEYPFKLKICQDWDKIQITTSTGTSTSQSATASFIIHDCVVPTLSYTYLNEPQAESIQTMNIHLGQAKISLEGDTLKGEYFNGRGRSTWGYFELKRDAKP